MKQWSAVIRNPTGLHARPAWTLVDAAKRFAADIRIQHGNQSANGKSLISILALGVEHGAEITFLVNGVDENEASVALEKLIYEGLGEPMDMQNAAQPQKESSNSSNGTPAALAHQSSGAGREVRGTPAAPGVAIGRIFQLVPPQIQIDTASLGVDAEKARSQAAVAQAQTDLAALRDDLASRAAPSEAAIFDVHIEILHDPDVRSQVEACIATGQSAAAAWRNTLHEHATELKKISDPLLAERAADINDVSNRILRILSGQPITAPQLPNHPVIVVARDVTPSDMATLDRRRMIGICMADGGPMAHASILARALGIPAVVGSGDDVIALADGSMAILNGMEGSLIANPTRAQLSAAEQAQAKWQEQRAQAAALSHAPATTQDGHRVEIAANIGGIEDARGAAAAGAEGVGLLRTEFLFVDSPTEPSEQTQYEIYRDIVTAMGGAPVIARTLDIGGDKPVAYLDMSAEKNPLLGERGIRLCLNRPDLLRRQLRALMRAAAHGPLRIMFPMVAEIGEWRAVRAMAESVRVELGAPEVPLGIMIEVPSAALMADVLAREVDFFSIGTNDLTQYTLAMDRQHPVLAAQADALHPAVLRLIARTVEAAHAVGKWVGICGEAAADPQATPILVGLGVDELSVSPPSVSLVKAAIRAMNFAQAASIAGQALLCANAAEVRVLSK